MECDICERAHHPKRLPFLCAVDARNRVYEDRLRHVQVLLESEGLRGQIQTFLQAQDANSKSDASTSKPDAGKPPVDALRQEQLMSEDRTTHILEAADRLRSDISSARDEIQARKAALARRRSDLSSVSTGLDDRRTRQLNSVKMTTHMRRFRWSQSAEDMATTRAFLCAEAASLYGLERVARPNTGGKTVYDYYIGNVPVLDPLEMNSLSPEHITTSLGHMTRVLILGAYYLSIRLPAEITLPHRDYPYPTILSLASSYHYADLAFPGPSGTSPPTSLSDHGHLPRPRPLYLSKPLPQLLKDDPAAYALFIEAVALLAYNIAWLCSTQGVALSRKSTASTSTNTNNASNTDTASASATITTADGTAAAKPSFDDICRMGRNLYKLLVERPTDRQKQMRASGNQPPTQLGRYSHATTYYFLGSAQAAATIRRFDLPGPTKLADKLKRKLVGDVPAPDWEVLDDDAWKVEEEPSSSAQAAGNDASEKPQSKSTGRWTKVRL